MNSKTFITLELGLVFAVLGVFSLGLKTLSTAQNSKIPALSIKGDVGNQGIQGMPGLQGATGLTGVLGVQGDAGVPGAAGTPGATGEQGQQGLQGLQGEAGAAGQSIEFQIDPLTHNLECQIVGDTLWTPLVNPGDSCP